MKKLALMLYKSLSMWGIPLFRRGQVDADLMQLHPGEQTECLKTEYYVKKLSLSLLVMIVGGFLGFAVRVSMGNSAVLEEDRIVSRGNYPDGEQEVVLWADDGERERTFEIMVQPRTLTQDEAEAFFKIFLDNAGDYILNGNPDFQNVSADLLLEETYEGFPFTVSWESSRPDILDENGTVGERKESVPLELKVKLTYGEWTAEKVIELIVVPPVLTEEEQAYLELREYLVKTEEDSRQEEKWILPEQWQGREMRWKRRTEDFSFLIWAVTPGVAAMLFLMADKDLHKELEKRHKALRQEYPELVHKLLLYVGAGMTIRGAFKKIAGDYEKSGQRKKRLRHGCEEVLYTCRELQGGVSEGAAYEHFGKRAGVREYIRLGTLLGQNLKRGSSTLLERLREEAEKASAENLLQVRKLGEEAGTKLLLPMVMMLAVVMVMIMVPAFGTM